MPKDRLEEFKNAASSHGKTEDEEAGVTIRTPFKIRLNRGSSKNEGIMEGEGGGEDKILGTFLKDIEWLSENLTNLSSRVDQVKQTQASILSSPSINQELRDKLDQQNIAIKNLSRTIQKELKVIDGKIRDEERENEERERVGERKNHWADLRIKKSQYRAMMHRFTETMTLYNDLQQHYKEQCKKRIQRSLQIANREMSEEEIERMIESEDPQIFSEQYSVIAKQAKMDLQELEVRHNELIKLESSLKELKDLFLDVALLVGQQGEMIDRVELQVEQTKEFVEESVKHTQKAVVSKKKANKRKVCIIGCVSVTVVILVLLITISVVLG